MAKKTIQKKSNIDVVSIFATIGAILVALGIAWMFISNWESYSTSIKIIILLGATGVSYASAYFLDQRSFGKTAQAVYLLTCLLWGLSVFIIAQQFNYGLSLQENANLAIVTTIGVTAMAYGLASIPCLIIALIAFFVWALLQVASIPPSGLIRPEDAILYTELLVTLLYFFLGWFSKEQKFGKTFSIASIISAIILAGSASLTTMWGALSGNLEIDRFTPFGAALFLAAAGLLYRGKKLPLAAGFTWAAVAVMLYTALGYTNQSSQAMLAQPLSALWSLKGVLMVLLPLVCMAYAINEVKKAKNIKTFDLYAPLGVYAVYLLCLIFVPMVLGTGSATLEQAVQGLTIGAIWTLPGPYIIQWLIFNVLYIVAMLMVISFASKEDRPSILKTALLFFGVYIIARYIGFMIDLSGYLALSILLIVGGLGLIALSIGYHKLWKSKMVTG